MSGSYNSQAENNINAPAAMLHVKQMVQLTAAANEESQAQAHAFIQANGAEVLDGHAPVNPAADEFMKLAGQQANGYAPEYPPGLDTFAVQNALVGPGTSDVTLLLHPSSASAQPVMDAGED